MQMPTLPKLAGSFSPSLPLSIGPSARSTWAETLFYFLSLLLCWLNRLISWVVVVLVQCQHQNWNRNRNRWPQNYHHHCIFGALWCIVLLLLFDCGGYRKKWKRKIWLPWAIFFLSSSSISLIIAIDSLYYGEKEMVDTPWWLLY